MQKAALTLVLAFASLCAHAQALEPGEWQFNSTVASPMMQGVQSSQFVRCIRKEEADKPESWMGSKDPNQSDCKVVTTRKTADTVSWEINCQKSNMKGSGTARLGKGTLESEQKMTGEMQGRSFEMNIKTNARRLGACKG